MKKLIVTTFLISFLLANTSTTQSYQRPPDPEPPTIPATVTKYGWTGNRMANGEYPYPGAVAISDRTIPLGTKIEIDGKEYVVKDRTAKWVHKKHNLTIDIYSEESNEAMLAFGRKSVSVKIK